MCGFLIGALCAIALVKVIGCGWRMRHAYRRCGYGGYGGYGGCGGGRWGRGDHWRRRGDWGRGYDDEPRDASGPEDGFGKRYFLRWISQRLDATPGQEKVIQEAVSEILEAAKKARGDWWTSFTDVAKAIRGSEFDHDAVGEAWVKHDGAFESVRLSIVTALQRIHEALDEKQREILADLIEKGPGRFGGFRGWHGHGERGAEI